MIQGALNFSEVPIAGNRHFFVSGSRDLFLNGHTRGQARPSSPAILTAHYDRVPGSPGANDNSAAVFMLLETALKLRDKRAENWFIIFTDKEELSKGEGLIDQGSYALALGLKSAGFGNARVFSFDTCGVGDSLIISTGADELLQTETGPGIRRARKKVEKLREEALKAAHDLEMDRVFLLPTPFSDDGGFLRGGISAQTITVLPQEETSRFGAALRKKPGLGLAILGREPLGRGDLSLVPETWQTLNSPADCRQRLTPQHYNRVIRFAGALCGI